MLAAGPQPLFWHAFDLPTGDEETAILAANSTLWMLGRHSRITLPIDTVIVHGRPELTITQDPEAFRQRTGARLIRCAEAGLRPGRRRPGSRPGQPPWRRAPDTTWRATQAGSLHPRRSSPGGSWSSTAPFSAAVSLFLIGTAAEANARLQAVGTELTSFSWLKKQDQAKLDAEKKALAGTIEGRASVSGQPRRLVRGVANRRGRGAREHHHHRALGRRRSRNRPRRRPRAKAKKQLIVNFATPMSEDGSVPREIDGFLAALRGDADAQAALPAHRGHRPQGQSGQTATHPFASYSVVCLPKAETIRHQPAKLSRPTTREPSS